VVKRIQFSVDISAPSATVFRTMLDPDSYKDWTSAFAEGSYYEGSWQEGEKIKFLSPAGDGIVSEIAEHRPNEFISIRHLGFISQGVEDTHSEAARAWAPAYENYTFRPTADGTRLGVDLDVTEEWEQHMAGAWPKALQRLKVLCEGGEAADPAS
jgi:uncharacterized protein YndB with AHSA1/START domain